MTDPGPILARLGLQQYLAPFADEGFDTWETILEITESDLDALKVKLGHRRILQREILAASSHRGDYDTTPESPSQTTNSSEPHQDTIEDGMDPPGLQSAPRQKRRYRRHPKVREDLRPLKLSFTVIAKKVGESWQLLSPGEKERYETQAAASKEKYNREMATYKITDLYREYQRYLADFKAKHGNNTGTPPSDCRGQFSCIFR
ncbi:uncharacterized protein KY384_009095 [Bacidia gigantensis]|uniref:uncharacterized protein n=1 Tax=Bacidia gigantensis TaxID=2732470 RepID=UPI001D03B361|nr:uncharacterized protein KY384_009095 [Bacidia gigantensis]KAG8525451.1 hypothetical protein KY384_009095 [Bacidia gigantensis]